MPRKVYAIQHNKTKRIYIGSSHEPEQRYLNHLYRLRAGKHCVEDMQDDFNDYGEDYSFYILDEIKDFDERCKEYEWMNKYDSTNRTVGYNYKDREKCYSKRHNSCKDSKTIDEQCYKDIPYKRYLIQQNKRLMYKCEDIPLLELVMKLLSKSTNSQKAQERI